MYEFVKNMIIGLVSGVISGMLLNWFYNQKYAFKCRTKFFIELRDCIINLTFECEQLYEKDTCYESYNEMHDTLRKIKNIYVPVDYKWLKLNEEEQKYVNEFDSIHQKIKDIISIMISENDEMNAVVNNYNAECELTESEYHEQLNTFIATIISCKRDLEQECLKFKGKWPILETIMKKYRIK